MKDLPGKKLLLVQKTVSEYLLDRAMTMNGMRDRIKQVRLINTSDSDIATAFLSDASASATVTWKPLVSQIVKQKGITSLFNSSQIPGEILDLTVVRTEILNRPEMNLTVPEVAAKVYDNDFSGTGNWPFNTAFAGSFRGMRSYVSRFDDLSEVEDWIAAGIPVILSARWDLLQPGRPLDANGHLIVCIGFTENGDVVINDPATRLEKGESVRRIYKRADVIHSWTKSHNAVYLVYPETEKIPANRYGHW